jgi:hypothetical protein
MFLDSRLPNLDFRTLRERDRTVFLYVLEASYDAYSLKGKVVWVARRILNVIM